MFINQILIHRLSVYNKPQFPSQNMLRNNNIMKLIKRA